MEGLRGFRVFKGLRLGLKGAFRGSRGLGLKLKGKGVFRVLEGGVKQGLQGLGRWTFGGLKSGSQATCGDTRTHPNRAQALAKQGYIKPLWRICALMT